MIKFTVADIRQILTTRETEIYMAENLIKMGIAVVMCILCILILKFLYRKISRKKTGIQFEFISSLLNVVFIAICVFYCLSLFEETAGISSTILKSSALLLAIATFAAQRALGNVFSGIFLSFSKPYDIGDKVKILNNANVLADGKVTDITIRHTVIGTYDGQTIIIPNSVVDSAVVMNYNYDDKYGNIIDIPVDKNVDLELAMSLIKQVVDNADGAVNTDKSIVTVSRVGEKTVSLKVPVWSDSVEDNFKTCSKIRLDIVKAFKENGI